MTLQQLKYIITVAEKDSLTEAAKELYISQPSLTKSIKELETEMGITIFDRTNKGISERNYVYIYCRLSESGSPKGT